MPAALQPIVPPAQATRHSVLADGLFTVQTPRPRQTAQNQVRPKWGKGKGKGKGQGP